MQTKEIVLKTDQRLEIIIKQGSTGRISEVYNLTLLSGKRFSYSVSCARGSPRLCPYSGRLDAFPNKIANYRKTQENNMRTIIYYQNTTDSDVLNAFLKQQEICQACKIRVKETYINKR